MSTEVAWEPRWADHPGGEISELLRERGMTQREFAMRLGVTLKHVGEICNGHSVYSPALALKMEEVLGAPTARYWMHRLADYQLSVARGSPVPA